MARLYSLALAASIALASAAAQANGAFPKAGQLVVNPLDAQHIVVRSTFGMLVSYDQGQSWGWLCETGVGYVDEEPGIAVTGDGSILAAWSQGVSIAPGKSACDWTLAGVAPAAVDVSVQKNDPTVGVAVSFDLTLGQVWESIDQGASWATLGSPLPAGFKPTTLDVAPSDPSRIYVAGVDPANEPLFASSPDRGDTWTVTPLPKGGIDLVTPYLSAIDPVDPDIAYVRMAADPARLLVTQDGGDSWIQGFAATGPMRGFALSPDGQELVLGDVVGVWHGSTSSLSFTMVSATPVQCLTWTAEGVYACGNQYVNGFFVGVSHDEGATYTPLISMHCIRPLDCALPSSVAEACPAEWPAVSMQLVTDQCNGEGGAGGAATSAQGATSAAGVGGGEGANATAPPGSPSGGCACSTERERSSAAWWLVLVIPWLRRRHLRGGYFCSLRCSERR